MANQTLTGCIDFGTGLAKFDQDDCEYSGCMIWGGVHAKQVAVTIDTSTCDDIYYGCVEFPSGRFSVVVPDNCCSEFGEPCIECTDLPPKCISMSFTDWDACCFPGVGSHQVTVHSLPILIMEQSEGLPCTFNADDTEESPGFLEVNNYIFGDCDTEPLSTSFYVLLFMNLTITDDSTIEIDIIVDQGFGQPFPIFHATIDELDDPCEYLLSGHIVSNEFVCGGGIGEVPLGGGSVTIGPASCPVE